MFQDANYLSTSSEGETPRIKNSVSERQGDVRKERFETTLNLRRAKEETGNIGPKASFVWYSKLWVDEEQDYQSSHLSS